jgi:glutaconate CoA-transferase subunit B
MSSPEPAVSSLGYTPQELMVVAGARQIRDEELVFVGMRLPLLAFCLAKNTHAPGAVGLFENGIVRATPASELLYTMSDPPNVAGASWCTSMQNVMALLARGDVALGFIGGAQVDRFGNVNTSYIGDPFQPSTKLPGSGGACDIAALAGRTVVIMEHGRRRLVERVDYVTSPGHGDGPAWRGRVGLPGGGPSAIITTLAVLEFEPETAEAVMASYHPGSDPQAVRAATGWDLRSLPTVGQTPPPTRDELAIIRRYDPRGYWTGRRGDGGREDG